MLAYGDQPGLDLIAFRPPITTASQAMLLLAFSKFGFDGIAFAQTLLVGGPGFQRKPYLLIGILLAGTVGSQTNGRVE